MNFRKSKLVEIANINPDSINKNYQHKSIEYIDISSVGTGVLDLTSLSKNHFRQNSLMTYI